MIALVANVVLPALFAGSGLFALVVLVGMWRSHGGAFSRLRAELARCDDMQALSVTIARHDVRQVVFPRPVRVSRRAGTRLGLKPALSLAQPAAA